MRHMEHNYKGLLPFVTTDFLCQSIAYNIWNISVFYFAAGECCFMWANKWSNFDSWCSWKTRKVSDRLIRHRTPYSSLGRQGPSSSKQWFEVLNPLDMINFAGTKFVAK